MDFRNLEKLYTKSEILFEKQSDGTWKITVKAFFTQKNINEEPVDRNYEHTVFHKNIEEGFRICMQEFSELVDVEQGGVIL